MRTKRIFWLFSLTLALTLLGAYPGLTAVEPKPETRGPVVTHAFAVEKGYYGYIWKIYLEAEDPDGQMGLKPVPANRLRGAFPHLLHS